MTAPAPPNPPADSAAHTPPSLAPANAAATAPAPRRKRRRWLRWMLFSAGAIGILLLVLICIVQILLWSSTPRNLAMSIIQQKLGLHASANTLSTTWFGRTTLTNVQLALPLSNQPFVTIPKVIVHHRWLTALALTGDIGIRSVELDQPTLSIRRDALGRWNLQDVVELIANAVGPPNPSAPRGGTVDLPAITIVGATLDVSDASGRNTRIGPIDMTGVRKSAVTWQFTVSVPGHVAIAGLLAPGGAWQHEMTIDVHDVGDWLNPWFSQLPADAQVKAHWAGQLTDSPSGPSLVGLLMLHDLSAAKLEVAGFADASIGPDEIDVHPRSLSIATPIAMLPRADVVGGAIALANDDVTVKDLALQVMGGPAKLSASYNLDAGTGQATAAWSGLTFLAGMQDSGTISATLTRPFPTQLRLDAAVNSTGAAPAGPFAARFDFSAAGSGWTHFDWQAHADQLTWQRFHPIDLSGLQATGSLQGTKLSLDSVGRPADPELGGYGWYDFSQGNWAVLLAGQTWPFHPADGETFAFHLDADGDRQQVELHDFSLRHGQDTELIAKGSYATHRPKPVALDVKFRNQSSAAIPSILGGQLEGSMRLSGTLWPRQLDVAGQLHGTELSVGDHHLGDVSLKLSGNVDDERADIKTDRLAILGGTGDLEGIYAFAGDALDVGLVAHDLSLAQAGRLAGQQDWAGTLGGHWHLFLPGLSLDPRRIRLSGLLQANDAYFGTLLAADEVDATTTLQDGLLELSPITMLRGKAGSGSGDLSVDLSNTGELRGALSLKQWPVDLLQGGGSLSVDLTVPGVTVNLPTPAAGLRITAPQVYVVADAMLSGKPAGHVELLASSAGRIADLRKMDVTLLGGTLSGQGHLDLDQFSNSTGQFDWQQLDSAAIAEFVPELTGLSGRMTGACSIGPATSPLALEPVAMHLRNAWTGGRYKTIALNDLALNAYLNRTAQSSRVVLADDPAQKSVLHLAGGSATIWARCGVEPNGVGSRPFASALAQVTFDNLDVSQLLDAVDPSIGAVRGRLSGNFMLLGNSPPPPSSASVFPAIDTPPSATPHAYPRADSSIKPPRPAAATTPAAPRNPALAHFIDYFYGEGHVDIVQSNLANLGVLTQIYNIMHFAFGSAGSVPVGYGDIDVRLESGNLAITNLRYFNRGTEVDALATIDNLADLPNSPLKGSAIGSLHPLSQIPLPFVSDVDTVLSIIQRQVTPVTLSGTIHTPKVNYAAFRDLTSDMKNYLLGNTEQNARQ